jgi:hypothetical protein
VERDFTSMPISNKLPVEAKDGEADFVGCGSGNDVASVDLADRVARDCETIYPG